MTRGREGCARCPTSGPGRLTSPSLIPTCRDSRTTDARVAVSMLGGDAASENASRLGGVLYPAAPIPSLFNGLAQMLPSRIQHSFDSVAEFVGVTIVEAKNSLLNVRFIAVSGETFPTVQKTLEICPEGLDPIRVNSISSRVRVVVRDDTVTISHTCEMAVCAKPIAVDRTTTCDMTEDERNKEFRRRTTDDRCPYPPAFALQYAKNSDLVRGGCFCLSWDSIA